MIPCGRNSFNFGPTQVIQDSLIEAIGIVANIDFPADEWRNFIEQTLSKLAVVPESKKLSATLAAFKLFHRVFKRYRQAFRSDELYTEINFVMSQLAPSLLDYYQLLSHQSGSLAISSLVYLNKVYYDLSFQDLPAFFEDHLDQFMTHFLGHLSIVTEDVSESDRLKVSVIKIVTLYAQRYEEDFPQLITFIQNTWQLTTNVQSEKLQTAMLRLIATVAKQERHKGLFESEEVLNSIIQKLVLPNLTITEDELELFEDEPNEFMRRDAMGDEGKRGAAIELVRSLLILHNQHLTSIIQSYIQSYLQMYAAAPTEKWQLKLVAVQLFISIAITGAVTAHGVSQVNPLCDIPTFLQTHIVPDLQHTNAAMHPMLKVTAIKWVQVFRNQLTKELLTPVFAVLLHHLTSHNVVIHSFAAIAIDKFLSTRRGSVHLFSSSDISDLTPSLVDGLQSMLIKKSEVVENEHLIRALNRVILTVGRHPSYKLDTLVWILEMVSKNPANPYFLHGLFESIAAMIRFGARVDPFLPFASAALQGDETVLHPYIWQVLAAAVEYSEIGMAKQLLQSLFTPEPWTNHDLVPALVAFVEACLLKLDLQDSIQGLLGIFQALLASRLHESLAFSILSVFIQTSPDPRAFLTQALLPILTKLHTLKGNVTASTRVSIQLVLLIATYNIALDSSSLLTIFESIQPGLLNNLVKSVISINIVKIRALNDRRVALVGSLKLIDVSDQAAATVLVDSIIQCLSIAQKAQTSLPEREDEEESHTTDTSYSRLISIPRHGRILKAQVPDPVNELISTLKRRPELVQSLAPQQQAYLGSIGF